MVSMEQSASASASDLKARISRENTKSRRFSASNLKSFREDERCLRSSTTISSTASSPGYTSREEIDPSTYSFTAALKALQAKAVYSWEYLPSHRLTLHSKWSDAEKYISNPLSGEVPLECLSAKTLSARSFSTLTNRITISAPLVYQTNYPIIQHQHKLNITIKEKKRCTKSKDVGTQSTPADLSSATPSPLPTPSIQERSKNHCEGEFGDSSVSGEKEKSEAEVEEREEKENVGRKTKEGRERKKMMMMMCGEGGGRRGCLPLKGLWQRNKRKPRKNNNPSSSPTFLYHINACFDE